MAIHPVAGASRLFETSSNDRPSSLRPSHRSIPETAELSHRNTSGRSPAASPRGRVSRTRSASSRIRRRYPERHRRSGCCSESDKRSRSTGFIVGCSGRTRRLIEVPHRGLLPVREPAVRGTGLPAVKNRLVLPVVILPSHHQRLLYPHAALRQLPARLRPARGGSSRPRCRRGNT